MSKQTGFSFASSKKSLIETIDEIKKSKMPRNEKIVALKACGLREKEISDMLKVYVPSGSTSTRFVYTFGVEIECVHAERNALIEAGRQNGVDIHSEGYNHTDKQGNVTMTAEESREAFKQWIENDSYAKNHRGQYAERNSNLSNWEHEIDLHLAQTIYNVQGIGKLEFTFDIINFANMLNKKWGASYSSAYNLSPLTMTGLSTDADGNKIASFSYNKAEIQKSDISSRWHCQVGVRLTF
jgi:heme-degrading monooxygenase HmoA